MSSAKVRLPQAFIVKYLGKRPVAELWGIEHTRRPVDDMVQAAKRLAPGHTLPLLQLLVSNSGINIAEMKQNLNKDFESGHYPVDAVSYGVQDVTYTRVFAMIVVRDSHTAAGSSRPSATDCRPHSESSPMLECHAFVCDRCESARRLTHALAAVFNEYSERLRDGSRGRLAIDLRPIAGEQLENGHTTTEDSEA